MPNKPKTPQNLEFFENKPDRPGRTDEWLTAQPVLAALGGWQSFDLDPCAPAWQPWPTARAVFTRAENGLLRGWQVFEFMDKSGTVCLCDCHEETEKGGQISGSSAPVWSPAIGPGFNLDSAAAPGAGPASLQTSKISRAMESGFQAGAAAASGAMQQKKCGNAGLTPPTWPASLPQNGAMPTPKRGAKQSAAIPSSTTTGGNRASTACAGHGQQRRGQHAKPHGGTAAPTVVAPEGSPKTISTPSTVQDAPGQSHGTCFQPVGPAIPANTTIPPSTGLRTRPSCAPHCVTCAAKACRQISRQARVFLNPPYSTKPLRQFMARLAAHGWGTAVIPAATDTDTFARFVWGAATAVFFPLGRLTFHRPDGTTGMRPSGSPERADHASAICAYGQADADRLAACGLPGHFQALLIPRGWLVLGLGPAQLSDDGGQLPETWRAVVAAQLAASAGAVRLDDLYRALATHPKARRNPHWRAKVRQQVQLLGLRTGRGEWRARA